MSLALHYWMGDVHHCSGTLVSEMTYTVSSGTLNPSIPYHTFSSDRCINLCLFASTHTNAPFNCRFSRQICCPLILVLHLFLCFARLVASVVTTTTSFILSSSKIQNGVIVARLTQVVQRNGRWTSVVVSMCAFIFLCCIFYSSLQVFAGRLFGGFCACIYRRH